MKLALKISVILNVGLIGGLVFIWANQREGATSSKLPVEAKAKLPVRAVAASTPPIVRQAEMEPFHWSQLESSDYRTYIKNLRDIGCPETTLHAIVTADVNTVYQKRSRELEQKLEDINNSSWSVQFKSLSSQQTLKAELLKLSGEEIAEIADLLGLQPAPAREAAVNTTSSSQTNTSSLPQVSATPSFQADTASSAPVDATLSSQVSSNRYDSQNSAVLPLVFQNVNLPKLNLDNQQIQAINDLRQSFVDKIGGLNQDPHDPSYLDRWQKAQPEADDMLRGMLGITAWENYQVATWTPPSGETTYHP